VRDWNPPEVTLWFTSFGIRIAVHSDDPVLLAPLLDRTPAAWRPAEPGLADRIYSVKWDHALAQHVVAAGAQTVSRGATLNVALDGLELDARHFVAEFAPGWVFVHAGAVAVNGRAVVIPGRSGAGKSTLVAALLDRGATYYSDEYAVFDVGGNIHAYPKPLTLRSEAGSQVAVNHQQFSEELRPVPLGAVVVGAFAGLDTTWQPSTESATQGMMALLDNTVAIRHQPATTMASLQSALADVTVLVGPRGDAGRAADAVMERFQGAWV
jgi:hypothetical protein